MLVMFKSESMKVRNADRAKLSPAARAIYLRGLARLSKCEEVAKSGNSGRGFEVSR